MAEFKIINRIRDAWLILGITLFLWVLFESIFSIAFLVRDYLIASDSRIPNTLARPEDDTDTSWLEEYSKELEKNSLRWTSYVYWRRKTYNGKYININSDGIRLTKRSQTSPDKEGHSFRVFMFGGSTMWGQTREILSLFPHF